MTVSTIRIEKQVRSYNIKARLTKTDACFMQVNLKPSALKNEVNAALHFVKFLKRTRNLAVTDAPFYATLENVKDMLETFQVRY